MKALFTRLLPLILIASGFPALALADNYSFDFKAEKKKLEGKRTTTLERTVSDEKWCYSVTITNHSFKDIPNVDIKYIVYYKRSPEGSKVSKEKHISGGTTAAILQNNGNFVFETDSVELLKSQLEGGFYYDNGAKGRSRDSLTGIWIRIYQGETMVGEYADPPSLTGSKWEEK